MRGVASRLGTAAALLLIVLGNVLGSLHWIQRNVVLVGHDSTNYLLTSVEYAQFLVELTPQTLFRAFTESEYRTPALYLAVQPFYWLWGVNADSAQLLNIGLLAVVLVLTYGLGAQVGNRPTGLFAALMVGLLPMLAAMARLFYTEIFLTATVVLSLLALYRAEGFTRRGWSLVWGASLGIGLLVKWTLPIYVALPVLWASWQAGIWARPTLRWRAIRLSWPQLAAIGLAALLTLLWYWPNRMAAQAFPLGPWLAAAWFILLAAGLLVGLAPTTSVTNWWAALLLAALIASLWYLPRANFLGLLVEVDQERAQTGNTFFSFKRYFQYFGYFYQYHFGALAFWLITPAALWPWVRGWWAGRAPQPQTHLLWLSLLSAYGCLLLIGQQNQRNLVPLLPGVVVLFCLGLQQYGGRTAQLLGGVWVVVLAVQWSLYTFDRLSPFYVQSRPLWAEIMYAMPPASLETDPAYWVAPEVLELVAQSSDEPQTLGLLVNMHQIHRGLFRYLDALNPIKVRIKDGTESDARAWYNILTSHWLLFKRGSNHNVEAPGQAALARIFAGDPIFNTLFTPVKEYPLPNGEVVHLYQRVKGTRYPEPMQPLLDKGRALAEAINAAWSEHTTILYSTPDLAYWISLFDPAARRSQVFDPMPTPERMFAEQTGTLLVVVDYNSAPVLTWLDHHGYRAYEVGDEFAALAVYGRPTAPLMSRPGAAQWAETSLTAVRTLPVIQPGEVLPVELTFTGVLPPNLKLSARLVDGAGAVIASHDREVTAEARLGLFVPPAAAVETLTLVLVVYDGATVAPIPDQQGNTATVLAQIAIQSG